MNNDKPTIAERVRAATIADSAQEGVSIAEGRFGSTMASLCRELDALIAEKMVYGNPRRPQHQGEPIYQVQYRGDGGGGWSDAEKASYDAKVPHPKHWRARIVYTEQSAPVDTYPPCDYCGTVPDYHPWHGSGEIGGKESPHIHACSGCRHKLPDQVSLGAAKAFAKGFNTLEQAGGKYRINMQFSIRDDAWAAYGALGKLSNTLNTK